MIRLQNLRTFFVAVALIGIYACSSDDAPLDNENTDAVVDAVTGVSTFGIRHDKTLAAYQAIAVNPQQGMPSFGAVVAFEYSLDGSDNREFVATGTLINSKWILTAGHNFFEAEEQSAPAPVSGILVHLGNDPNTPTQTNTVKRLVFHPTWISDNNLFQSANDLCLVELNTPITTLTPAPLFTSTSEVIGSTVWYCGFGDYSGQPGQNPDLFSKKHAIENILDRKVEGIRSTTSNGEVFTGGLLAFDFDNPSGTINALGDTTINEDERLLGSGTSAAQSTTFEGATVQGDSGGPLFIKDGNTWKLAGVLSGGADNPIANHKDSDYGDISIFIRVSTHIPWIQSVIN